MGCLLIDFCMTDALPVWPLGPAEQWFETASVLPPSMKLIRRTFEPHLKGKPIKISNIFILSARGLISFSKQ